MYRKQQIKEAAEAPLLGKRAGSHLVKDDYLVDKKVTKKI